uniref:Trafficking protein particle complex subunit n=1 Tax=Neobodo designis TaxID=312471 RepID=A0A7S1L174_NEODS|mmetsp:Transcript_12634/g.39316  ORF Transcript_12634/g.39316 Transcript_12634/m.39316 type:complete len:145 (+) Transcript_12634:32-466(+)
MPRTFELHIFHRSKPQDPIFTRFFNRQARLADYDAENIIRAVTTAEVCLGDFGVSDDAAGVRAVTTDDYKLHNMETATGYRFVLFTDPTLSTDAGQQVLQHIYARAFVELVAKDPDFRHGGAAPIRSKAFEDEVHSILSSSKLV